ncbi:MAG: PhzF family phenazine biosynthesis protein [Halopseudomonas aestusnigri]
MKYPFYIVDVFSSRPFGGNQLAVLPNATGLSTEAMQKIAREFNFAESTFVFPSRDERATAKVRIFTPKAEVDFAGHPTVGTACALLYGGHIKTHDIILEENIGLVPVAIVKNGKILNGTLTNTSPLAYPSHQPDLTSLKKVLSLENGDVLSGCFAGVGLNFCFAQLSSRETVDRAEIDKAAWKDLLSDQWSSNLFLYAGDAVQNGEIYARMFAPALGIEEDPATGSAIAALAGVAAINLGFNEGELSFSVLQGVAMGRRSEITATAVVKNSKLISVGVGGATSFTASGEIEVLG